jgi:hypothetical protein
MSTSELPSPLTDLFAPKPQTAPTEVVPTPPASAPLVDSRAARMETKRAKSDEKPTKQPKGKSPKPAKQASAKPADDLRLSDYPIAHLLPPEVVAQGKVRTTRAIVIYVLIAVLILSVAAIAGSYLFAQRAQQSLQDVQSQNASVLAQEAKYAPARTALNKVKLAQSAQKVGAASEIDWNAYIAKVRAVLPAGVTITQFSGETSTPATVVTQDSAPLSQGRGAVITLTISAPDQIAIANTLDTLQKLPGYAGAFPGAITQAMGSSATPPTTGASSGAWSAPITLSLNDAAFANRFADTK